jgi:Bacterial shufflon protein, N-terminal constant region
MAMKLKQAAIGLRKLRASRGGWAIEATGALSLLVMLIGFGMYNENHSNNQRIAEISATHHKTVANAASAYVRDNYSALLAAAPAVGNITTVSFATLKNDGYVLPTLSPNNPWGQTMTLRVRRSSMDPNKVQLEGLVLGEGGTAVPHELAREVSQYIGAEGGYTVASGDYCGTAKVVTNTLCGTRGVWQRDIADFGAPTAPGHIASALFFKDGMVVNDYLYRNRVPGHAELTTMNTYIRMGDKAKATKGQPCYQVDREASSGMLPNGSIAKSDTGSILSCQFGVWKKMEGSGRFCPNPRMHLVLNRAGTYSIRNNDDCAWQFFAYQNSNKYNYIEIYIDGVFVGKAGMSEGYSVNGFVGGVILPGTTFEARLYQDRWPGQVYIQRP